MSKTSQISPAPLRTSSTRSSNCFLCDLYFCIRLLPCMFHKVPKRICLAPFAHLTADSLRQKLPLSFPPCQFIVTTLKLMFENSCYCLNIYATMASMLLLFIYHSHHHMISVPHSLTVACYITNSVNEKVVRDTPVFRENPSSLVLDFLRYFIVVLYGSP